MVLVLLMAGDKATGSQDLQMLGKIQEPVHKSRRLAVILGNREGNPTRTIIGRGMLSILLHQLVGVQGEGIWRRHLLTLDGLQSPKRLLLPEKADSVNSVMSLGRLEKWGCCFQVLGFCCLLMLI